MPKVKFVVRNQISFGKAVYVIADSMGWSISEAQRLNNVKFIYNPKKITTKKWEITLDINEKQLQYKYIVGDYGQLKNNTYNWENGENRKIQFKKYQNQSQVTLGQYLLISLVDKLDTRSIRLFLFGNNYFDLVLVFGNCKNLILPRAMKLHKIDKIFYLYSLCFYLELSELNSKIELIYDIIFEDQDYLSNKFQIEYSPQQQRNEVISLSLTNLKFIPQKQINLDIQNDKI